MPSLYYSREEVTAEAGVDPWKRYTDFANEINVEDIGASRNAYLRAADQATSVQDLATQATQISEQAGGTDGGAIVDGQSRDAETSQAMQNGGADIGKVVDHLTQAMNTADITHDLVRALIYADGTGLETTYTNHLQAALDEYNAWVASVKDVALEPGTDDRVAEEIRQAWLEQTAAAARTTDTDMTEEVEAYRRSLMTQAAELQSLGYDVTEGPFQAFTTDEMATWAAEGLNQQVTSENPDQGLIDQYLQGLEAIRGSVYQDPQNPGQLSQGEDGERDYLETLYNTLSPDALAEIGQLGDSYASQQDLVSDGMHMVMDPEIGGIDSASNPEGVPASIAEYLYGYGEKVIGQDSVDQYNGFASLVGRSDLTPSDSFAHDLGTSALDVQQAVDQYNTTAAMASMWEPGAALTSTPLSLTGTSDVLSHVAQNATASQGLLSDQGVREGMLSADWQNSQGIADVITSATRPDANGTMTAEQEDIADGVLTYYANNPDELIHDWETTSNPLNPDYYATDYDNVPLQGAVAEAALNRMDDIAGIGGVPASTYAEGDMYGVFSLMAATDPTVNEYFKSGITATEYELAHGIYSGAIADRENALKDIHDLNSLVNWGEQDALYHYADDQDKQDKLVRDLANASVGAVTGFVGAAVPEAAVGAAAIGSGTSLATPFFGEFEPQAPKELASYQYEQGRVNDVLAQYQMTAAAIAAHNERVPEDQQITPPDASAILGGSDDLADLMALDSATTTHWNNPALGEIGDNAKQLLNTNALFPDYDPDSPMAAAQRLEPEAVEARAAERAARNEG